MALIWLILGGVSLSLVLFYKFVPLIWAAFYTSPKELALAISDPAFIYSSQISFLWAIVSSTLLIFSALLISWYLRNKRKLLYLLIFVPWAIPMYLATLSLRFSIYGIGGESIISQILKLNVNITTNHLASFLWTLFVNNWIYLPIITLSFLATIDEIPVEIFEAAKLDGAKENDLFFSIALPHLTPAISGWFLMYFVKFFHSFTVPFLFADGGAPMMNAITKWGGFGDLYTLGVLNYKVFSLSKNLETVVAYSIVSVLIVFFITSFWFFRDKEKIIRVIGFFFFIFWYFIDKNPLEIVLAIIFLLFRNDLLLALIYSAAFILLRFKSIPSGIALIWLLTRIKPLKKEKLWHLRGILKPSFVATFIYVLIFSLAVVASLILTAFTDYPDMLFVTQFSFEPIKDVINDGYLSYLKNSLILAFLVSIISPIITLPVSFWISKNKEWIMQFFILLQAISGFHLLVQIFSIYSKLNLLDSLLAVVPLITANVIPQIIIIQRSFIIDFPQELRDISLLLGGRKLLYRIVFRYSAPIILVTSLIGFSGGWNAFLAPLILIFSESKYPTSVKLFDYVGSVWDKYPEWNLFGAGAVINVIIILIVFALNRYLANKIEVIK